MFSGIVPLVLVLLLLGVHGLIFLWLCRLAVLQLRSVGVMLGLVSFGIVVYTLMLSCMSGM